MRRLPVLTRSNLFVAVVALVIFQISPEHPGVIMVTRVLTGLLILGVLAETVVYFLRGWSGGTLFRESLPPLLLQGAFLAMIAIQFPEPAVLLVVIRAVLLLLPSLARTSRLSGFVSDIVTHPAQTVALSFLLAILAGTWLLMLPFTAVSGRGLSLIDALFTATSAICVTGLIVVDTATVFTVWGQIVIMLLIQVGGVGIMVLALFTLTLRRQAVSVESKLLLSYMISEKRITELSGALKRIVLITFGIEAVGAVLLFFFFQPVAHNTGHQVLLAVFHAVSAFCNAGFALFTTSLEQFHGHAGINTVVITLIIAGGISFGVLTNLFQFVRDTLRNIVSGRRSRVTRLTVNSKTVLLATVVLLTSGLFLFYALEFDKALSPYGTGQQYLAALFQSVTLRTAGFNTVPIDQLTTGTYIMMMVFMFVGGASGSTAGGIKVNNAAVILSYVNATRRGRGQTLLFGHAVGVRQTATAFTVLLFGIVSVVVGTFLMSLTEQAEPIRIVFEAVSAFGTVGLSTGITGDLTWQGRIIITVLMFIGRVGPLTLLAATATPAKRMNLAYPSADVAVG